ncbi:MAG: aminotransferase class V-fold PLP-dependent enzyme [Bacteroidetes bacterium]|nr:aminotransferase class V-fold PLP-dependent enzyme [Bacteroidota bacterium]
MFTEHEIQEIRREFLYLTNRVLYFNHAATGPLPKRTVYAMSEYLHEHSAGMIDTYEEDKEVVTTCRNRIASLINAESPECIAFVQNTSEAINVIARGLHWEEGDRVLVCDKDFPANVIPYVHLKSLGVEVDFYSMDDGIIDRDRLNRALTPSTKLVALSAVQFLTGYRIDLAAIGALCRSKNIWLVVDGIQGVGVVPVDVRHMNIDAMSCGGQKWLMAPQGTGFLYVSQRMHSALHPPFVGWLSVEHPWHFFDYQQPLASSARRYEIGTLNYCGLRGLNASIQLILEAGIERIHNRILDLTSFLSEELRRIEGITLLSPWDDHHRSGIVTIEKNSGGSFKKVYKTLTELNIIVSLREEKLRFSPHFYNTAEEIETVLKTLYTLL